MRVLPISFFLVLASVTQLVQTAAENLTATTERKYPTKELYRLIRDRLQSNRRPSDATSDGVWSEWSEWTPCSRSCGGGVASQTRKCLPHRTRRSAVTGAAETLLLLRNRRNSSSSSEDPNHLNALDSPLTGSRAGCVGLYKRYHMCNTQECPPGSQDFRAAQCESYNGKQFMGRYYIWEAYWEAENPCELNCRALTFRFYALLNKTVVDGTRCRPNDPTRICVAGSCKTVGCDGIVGSEKRPDGCGVCGGNNSTCQIVSGIFTEPQLPNGYNLVAQLPKGACHINITEFKPSRNYLALRRADGTFVFNGDWAINWSGEYQAAGTTFTYRRQEATITPELISSPGPLTEPIDIMVITQEINPGITYEYRLPLEVLARNQRQPVLPAGGFGNDLPGGRHPQVDSPQTGSSGTRELVASNSYPLHPRASGLGAEGGLFQTINQQSAGRSLGGSGYPSSLSSSGSLANLGISVPQQQPVIPASILPDSSSSPSTDDAGSVPFSATLLPPPPLNNNNKENNHRSGTDQVNGGGKSHNRRRHHGHQKQHHNGSHHHGASLESQGKHGQNSGELQAIDPGNTPPTQTHHRRGPRRHSNGKGFSWKQLGFSECSKTCGGGVQQALIVCVRERDQVPVADHRCKEEDRLPGETVRCNSKPCPAEWVLGEWSVCSAPCGEGIQTRDLTCKQEISPTLTMRVNEAACLNPVPSGPRVRNCNIGACSKWHASEWGKCTTSCGKGMRHRRVYCQGADGRDAGEAECPAAERPIPSEVCDMGSCSTNTWFFTDWTGQCSEECGTGTQTRRIHCSGESEVDCDGTKKPDVSRTCVSTKDCSGKWFAGPWSQCSATCDEGTQTREVICMSFIRGQYRIGLDIQCSAKDKPSATASCNLGKCMSQWYTSDWSECSASCGTGAQRREVKCLDSNQVPSQDCREEDRPMLRHACTARACNEVPEEDETAREAQDTPIISVEMSNSNRNESDPAAPQQDSSSSTTKVNHKKHHKSHPSSKAVSNRPASDSNGLPPSIAGSNSDEESPTAVTSSSGEGCSDKFKNCHLVVQARLCKLKYYLVSCCASCSKPKT